MIGAAGMQGFAPTIKIEPYNPEQSRYRKVWAEPEYRLTSPGELLAFVFLTQVKPERDATVIDFGCGTGRGGLRLATLGGMNVTLVDFADNCLDPDVAEACGVQPERIKFVCSDLTKTLPFNAAYGFCCDVMEHIPEADVTKVLLNILGSAQHVFFNISTVPDEFGPLLLGAPLHLTVKPARWWQDKLLALGAAIHWHQDHEGGCSIYCSAWRSASDVVKIGKINTDESVVNAQVAENIAAGWKHVLPHDKQDREVLLLCGGPSLGDNLHEIELLRAEGAALVTVNGAYGWALAHELEPSAQIVLDARPFNKRFVDPVTEYTRYLIASQVHPSTLEGLPRERTFLWHSGLNAENEALAIAATGGLYFPIPGGSTVVLRALPLLRLLGFWRVHLFGFDSCVRDGAHHAYAQAENDGEVLVPVALAGKVFQCTPWQVSQATEFRDLVAFLGDEIECAVHGDGLIATLIQTGADLKPTEA